MIKKQFYLKLIAAVLLTCGFSVFAENKPGARPGFKFEKAVESKSLFDIGIFAFSGMAVDHEGNVFLLNGTKSKIAKLDKNLALKILFGEKGQGPGEFNLSYSISVDKKGNVYIIDAFKKIIKYSGEGKLVKEVKLTGIVHTFDGFVLDPPVYVVKKMGGMKVYKALVIDISTKKTAGEYEMIQSPNFALQSRGGYISPSVPFVGGHSFIDVYDKYCVIGEGERFLVRLFDSSGKQLAVIKKDNKKQALNAKEKDFLTGLLYESLPAGRFSKNSIANLINKYEVKNPIHNIKIAKDRIYIFTVPDDITTTKQRFPVEIYDFKGKLITKCYFPKVPQKISGNYAYITEVMEEDEEEVKKLVKYRILENK